MFEHSFSFGVREEREQERTAYNTPHPRRAYLSINLNYLEMAKFISIVGFVPLLGFLYVFENMIQSGEFVLWLV